MSDACDAPRLSGGPRRVFNVMKDGKWRTVQQIERRTGDTARSVRDHLRSLREPRFGGHTVERQHLSEGLYIYRLDVSDGGKK